ncbi:hypothetical protein GW17_00037642 [Ensete ventricosum]|nr:hypothetical protein GW17_00037642 [Ensete ventricosum]
MFTARYERYIPVRQVAGTWTARYRAVPPKIDHRQSISAVDVRLKREIDRRRSIEGEIDRRRSIEREKGRKKKRKKMKKKEKKRKNTYCPRAVLARAPSSLVRRRRSRVAGVLSPARGERSRRHELSTSGVEMLSHDDDDEKWLAEGIAGIQHNAFYMQRALVGTQSYYNALIAKPNLHHSPNVVLLLV